MAKLRVAGLVAVAGALALPSAASAHDAVPSITCNRIDIAYSMFAINAFGTNTVAYKMTIDGVVPDGGQGTFLLQDAGGSGGTLLLPLVPTDYKVHTVQLYTWWGSPDTQTAFDDHGGSQTAPIATAELQCGMPPTPPGGGEQPPGTTPAGTGQPAPVVAGTSAGGTAPTTTPAPTVGGQSAPAATCAAAYVKRYRVRAKQLNTVQVKVRTGSGSAKAGQRVHVTAPGVSQTRKTNSKGIATFRIRPKRAGRLTVTATGCARPARVRVLAAKVSQSTRRPRYTG